MKWLKRAMRNLACRAVCKRIKTAKPNFRQSISANSTLLSRRLEKWKQLKCSSRCKENLRIHLPAKSRKWLLPNPDHQISQNRSQSRWKDISLTKHTLKLKSSKASRARSQGHLQKNLSNSQAVLVLWLWFSKSAEKKSRLIKRLKNYKKLKMLSEKKSKKG